LLGSWRRKESERFKGKGKCKGRVESVATRGTWRHGRDHFEVVEYLFYFQLLVLSTPIYALIEVESKGKG
jgi:hypothetical protein